ncbi:MAG: hypothetical protein Sylvanvirus16_2 [Sylvanvirus sp.]|uniref:Uncharacterized protein n=1 Tax=Sylvanvirus sp. TaxID=2487774 RepID=A0A3G5AJY9_9VIRU|nr:MAG: hypothetical protein Sylvanvirus16_2 [Sylvanvirus sp.]
MDICLEKTDEILGLCMNTSPPPFISLVSNDGTPVLYSREILEQSPVFRTILQGTLYTSESDDSTHIVDLHQVKVQVLSYSLKYLEFHLMHPPRPYLAPIANGNLKTLVGEWDDEFVKTIVQEEKSLIIQIGNFATMYGYIELSALMAMTISTWMWKKSTKEIIDIMMYLESLNQKMSNNSAEYLHHLKKKHKT